MELAYEWHFHQGEIRSCGKTTDMEHKSVNYFSLLLIKINFGLDNGLVPNSNKAWTLPDSDSIL